MQWGYNGQKNLVYPANTLAVKDSKTNNNDFIIYPNPLKNGQNWLSILKIQEKI